MKKSNKLLSLLLALALMVTMCFGTVVTSFAAGESQQVAEAANEEGAIIIQGKTGDPVKITKEQFDSIKTTTYQYSYINNYATCEVKSFTGVKLNTLLTLAGISTNFDADDTLAFVASDGYSNEIMCKDLYAPRYAYSNIAELNADKGPVDVAKANESKAAVEPLIVSTEKDGYKLYFGQAYPTERNNPKFASLITSIEVKDSPGKARKTWGKPEFSIEDHSVVTYGTELTFGDTKGFVYYTTDGATPDGNSSIYNVATKGDYIVRNPFKFDKIGKVTVNAIVKGFGSDDSAVVSQTFTVQPAAIDATKIVVADCIYNGKAQTPTVTIDGLVEGTDFDVEYFNNKGYGYAMAIVKGKGNYTGKEYVKFAITPKQIAIAKLTKGTKMFTASFSKSAKQLKLDGYQVEYSTDKTNWKAKNVSKTAKSVTVKKLTANKTYYVKARAYKKTENGKVYGPYSTVKNVKVK